MALKYAAVLIVILFLDLAALDDITTNKQTNFYFEYAFLLVSFLIFTAFGYKFRKKIKSD